MRAFCRREELIAAGARPCVALPTWAGVEIGFQLGGLSGPRGVITTLPLGEEEKGSTRDGVASLRYVFSVDGVEVEGDGRPPRAPPSSATKKKKTKGRRK